MKNFLISLLALLIPALVFADSGTQLSQSGDHVTLSCPDSAVSSLALSSPNASGEIDFFTVNKKRLKIDGSGYQTGVIGDNGSQFEIKTATASADVSADAGTHTFTNLIPAGSIVFDCSIRVTTLVAGCTSLKIGDGSDDDRWGASIAVTANTTTSSADITVTSLPVYAAATSVVITAVGGGADFTAGVIRATCTYLHVTGATS